MILAGCVWKWQGVLPLFTFDAISLVPFALPTLPSPQRHQTFSIALRPSLSQLSNIILPSINFASVSVSGRYRVDIVVTREN